MTRHKSLILSFLLLLAAIVTLLTICSSSYGDNKAAACSLTQSTLSDDVIRLHILADSDTKIATEQKLQVRDALLPYLNALTSCAAGKSEAMSLLLDNCKQLEAVARDTLRSLHCPLQVQVSLTSCYFPLRIYGSQTYLSRSAVIFPPGYYDTVNVIIGSGKGHNWWCLAYPSLCFIDASYEYIPTESKEYRAVFSSVKKSRLYNLFYGGLASPEANSASADEAVDVLVESRLLSLIRSWFQKNKSRN